MYKEESSKELATVQETATAALAVFQKNLASKLYGLDALSVAATSHAIHTNATWSYVTIGLVRFVMD